VNKKEMMSKIFTIPDLKSSEKSRQFFEFLGRKQLDEKSHPSIVNIKLNNFNLSLTCVDFISGNIIICGSTDSTIYLFDTIAGVRE